MVQGCNDEGVSSDSSEEDLFEDSLVTSKRGCDSGTNTAIVDLQVAIKMTTVWETLLQHEKQFSFLNFSRHLLE